MSANSYLERALFVIGDPGSGKSTQIRSMLQDKRFGEGRVRPTRRNLPNTYWINENRFVYVRLTSPQETQETIDNFVEKCDNEFSWGGRANLICPLQPEPSNNINGAASVIQQFVSRQQPERTRVVILSPHSNGALMNEDRLKTLIDEIGKAGSIEIVMVDARRMDENGFIYADFFDLT